MTPVRCESARGRRIEVRVRGDRIFVVPQRELVSKHTAEDDGGRDEDQKGDPSRKPPRRRLIAVREVVQLSDIKRTKAKRSAFLLSARSEEMMRTKAEVKEWAMRDSNPRHPACKAGALPTELIARKVPLYSSSGWHDWSSVGALGAAAQAHPANGSVAAVGVRAYGEDHAIHPIRFRRARASWGADGRGDGSPRRGWVCLVEGHRRDAQDRKAARAARPDRHPLHRPELPRARRRERVGDPGQPDALHQGAATR